MVKAGLQNRSRPPKSNYMVELEDLEPDTPMRNAYNDCICDLISEPDFDSTCQQSDRDLGEILEKTSTNAVRIDGAPCRIHSQRCRKCHYRLIEKQDCICGQLLDEADFIPHHEFERRKRKATPFLADGERCVHAICCVGCHFELLEADRLAQWQETLREQERERIRKEEKERLLRKAKRAAKKIRPKEKPTRQVTERFGPTSTLFDESLTNEGVTKPTKRFQYEGEGGSSRRIKFDPTDLQETRATKKRNSRQSITMEAPLAKMSSRPTSSITKFSKGPAGVERVQSLEKDSPKKMMLYDSRTIARDILRAAGKHPFLPALNAHLKGRL